MVDNPAAKVAIQSFPTFADTTKQAKNGIQMYKERWNDVLTLRTLVSLCTLCEELKSVSARMNLPPKINKCK